MKRILVDWLAAGLRDRGVEWISALCGHGLDPLFDAARRAGIRLVDTRNEQTAAYVADAYGRLTGRPGVCASSSGVAVANALTGVLNAWFDQTPMLCLSGSANLPTLGRGCFQDLDQAALLRLVTKYSRRLDSAGRAMQSLDEAWRLALEPPAGPVHLMLPMDVQREEVEETERAVPGSPPGAPALSEPTLDAAAQALAAATRPLIVAGSGLFYAGEADAVMDFAGKFQIPVQTPIWDRGVCDQPAGAFLGVIGAASGGPELLAQSDCVILAGAASDYRTGYLSVTGPVHRVDAGWTSLGEKCSALGIRPFASWLAEARRLREEFTERVEAVADAQAVEGRLHSRDIVRALAEVLPEEAVLLIDGGSIGQWAHQLLCGRRYPRHWLTCGRSGVVGYGIGGAMGARLAFPARPVVLLSGDGAFTFTVADLECAVRQKLNFVAIVADDRCWGITHSGHLRQFGQGIATELGAIRFDDLARSLGALGVRVEKSAEIGPALRSAMAAEAVTVIHVPVTGGNPA
jgi:thiamine pyrophosphate-dependent acetolactate synthase large subunit-like protein